MAESSRDQAVFNKPKVGSRQAQRRAVQALQASVAGTFLSALNTITSPRMDER